MERRLVLRALLALVAGAVLLALGPTAAPDRVLDWILIPTGWRHLGYRAVPGLWSDHLPVVSDVVRAIHAAPVAVTR